MSRTETVAFLARYRDTFNRLDGDAVADLWHVPGSIADSHGAGGTARVTTYADDAALRSNMRALCEVYRHNGFATADFELLDHVALGPQHAFANVHWTLRRADGSCLQAFHTGYQIARTPSGPRALLAVAYEERLAELRPDAAA